MNETCNCIHRESKKYATEFLSQLRQILTDFYRAMHVVQSAVLLL